MTRINDKISPLVCCQFGADAGAIATIITYASYASAIAGAAVSAYSAVQQGENQKAVAKFNEAVSRNDAIAAQEQAAYEANQIRRRNRALAGSQAAFYSKSGIDLSGSASDVMTDSAVNGELDALAALYTGRIRSDAATSGAMLQNLQADNALNTGYYGAAGSILGGVGRVANQYAQSTNRQNPRF
jgi:hypothetical protein